MDLNFHQLCDFLLCIIYSLPCVYFFIYMICQVSTFVLPTAILQASGIALIINKHIANICQLKSKNSEKHTYNARELY